MHRPLAAAALIASAFIASCGSGPETGDDDPGKTPAGQPTAEQSWGKAQEKESTADQVASFGRIQWLEEAALEYQWLCDHHPRSRQAPDAAAKVKRIRERLDEIKAWKRRWDDFDLQSRVMKPKPAYLPKAREDAAGLTASPLTFVRELARKRLEEVEQASRRTVEDAFERLDRSFRAALSGENWAAGWSAFGAFDPAYCEVFPEFGGKVAAARDEFLAAARAAADAQVAKAVSRFEAEPSWGPVGMLVRARERFKGIPVEEAIAAREKELRAKVAEMVRGERAIASKAAAPEPAPVPEPGPAPGPSPGTTPEEAAGAAAARALREPVLPHPVPEPAVCFDGVADPLLKADEWYFKAVELERTAVPGDGSYQARLKAAIETYEKVRDLYDYLLERNKGPDEQIEERLEKIQGAIFWCKKSLALDGD